MALFFYVQISWFSILGVYVYVCIFICCACLVMSNSLRPYGLQPTRLLCPWNFPDKNTGVGCHFLLHGIFPTQGSNLSPALTGGFFTTEPPRKPNLTIMRAQWAKSYVWTQEIPTFPHLSLSATQRVIQNAWSPVNVKVPAFLCLPMGPSYLQHVWFPATRSLPPYLCSYLATCLL